MSAVSAAALSLALLAGAPAIAQGNLQDSAAAGMAMLGFDEDVIATVSADQAAQIESVLGGTDDDAAKTRRIEEILGANEAAQSTSGVAQLQASVTADIAPLGIDTTNIGMLNLTQLAQIENIMNRTDSDDEKRRQVELIMAEPGMSPATQGLAGIGGATGLEETVRIDLARIGINADELDVTTLTVGQLTQIKNVMSASDSQDEQRQRVERILAGE